LDPNVEFAGGGGGGGGGGGDVSKFGSVKSEYKDFREGLINSTNLRNDIKVFEFNDRARAFGAGGADLLYIRLLDSQKRPLSYVVGGEDVFLEIAFKLFENVENVIIGFTFKDRLGQALFVDNTYLAKRHLKSSGGSGDVFLAAFDFRFPILPAGSYSISPAIANGTQDDHVQMKWIHDALVLDVQSSPVTMGLIGLPMRNIELQVFKAK
jgi:lipopolysaccharide transport system ATP-binding protein